MHKKRNTSRSCLRWKPTSRIFKIAGLRWIPTGKMFTDNTTKVDSEPPNGSNGDITNPYECDQTLNVSAGTTNSSAAQDPVIPTGPLVSISIDLDAPSGSHISSPLDHHSSSVHHGVAGEQYAKVNPFAVADHEPFVNVFAPDPTSEASSSGEIMMPELNQSTQPHEHIRKWTNSHPLDNIIGNPSRPLLKTAGFKPCKTKSMNLIATDVNGDLVLPPDSEPVNIAPSGFNKVQLDELGYQSRPTKKHLEAVKRVFWYLQGTINMGLWYPKDTAMALTAYADADHAGCQDTRRSTSGSAQFLVPNPMDESHYQTMACYNRILCTMTTRWP
ncbi:retrovirus-related pol polyprotein from transposon TNT 1-94 [Tanacetum coccineum]